MGESMGSFHVGCAVWAYRDWVGDLFPPGSRSGEFLSLYSRRLTAVEGNTTFYSIPDAATVQRWHDETPLGFQFCLKLPRTITHAGPLTPSLGAAIAFLDRMAPLGDRLGPCFAQLPPTYSPAYLNDLATFLQGWPHQQLPLCLEVRHLDWFRPPQAEQLQALLQAHQVGRVLLDTRAIYDGEDDPQVHSERKKPAVPLQPVTTSDRVIIRYISHPDFDRNRTYLAEWVQHIGSWLGAGKRVYFFAHCPIEARSPRIAKTMQHRLEQAGVAVPPLPWDHIQQTEQLSLF
jgi:uncharacterized protein YecE (DUF72 family)